MGPPLWGEKEVSPLWKARPTIISADVDVGTSGQGAQGRHSAVSHLPMWRKAMLKTPT